MANTYSQIYLQYVFAVKGRENVIVPKNKEELQKIMSGMVSYKKAKPIAVHCMPDHMHLLVGLTPANSISELIQHVKTGATKFINDHKWVKGKFSWQDGYDVFSYSRSQLTRVIQYKKNQEQHHKRNSFREEYVEFLKKFEINYGQNYLFEWYD